MSLPTHKTIRLLSNLERQVDAAFAELIHAPWRRAALSCTFEPAVDLRELEREYVVVVDLPGVLPDEVSVQVEDQTLILRGTRTAEHWAQAGTAIYAERVQGQFVRCLPLPRPVDRTQLDVSFAQGLLFIRIPKTHDRTESAGRAAGGS